MKIFTFLILIFLSSFVHAETYPVAATYKIGAFFPSSSAADSCEQYKTSRISMGVASSTLLGSYPSFSCRLFKTDGTIYVTSTISILRTCPSGGTVSGEFCINATACQSGYTRDPVTQICIANTCTLPEVELVGGGCGLPSCANGVNPMLGLCIPSTAVPLNCNDGTTVYVPEVCPYSWFDNWTTPDPGTSITCIDGRVTAPGESCYARFIDDVLNNDPIALDSIKFVGFGTGTLPTLGSLGPMLAKNASGELVATLPAVSLRASNLAGQPYNPLLPLTSGFKSNFNVASTVPDLPLGKLLQQYFKAAPTSDYATSFKAAASSAGQSVNISPSTGAVTLAQSSIELTSNQVAAFARSLDIGIQPTAYHPLIPAVPLPVAALSPFIQPEFFPWSYPSMEAVKVDFQRVFSPGLSSPQLPLNFPYVSPISPLITPSPSYSTPPLVSVSPSSPPSMVQAPAPVTSTLPDPTVNPNPTGTDVQVTPTTPPPSNLPIDPIAPELPPMPPDIYPDDYKFFDFLRTTNPFSFDIKSMLPIIPQVGCTYEINRTIHVPLLGDKQFHFAPCVPLQPLRDVLQWAFAVLTAWACLHVVLRSTF